MSTRRNFISFVSTLGAMAALPQTESQATAKKPQKIKVGQIGTKRMPVERLAQLASTQNYTNLLALSNLMTSNGIESKRQNLITVFQG